MSDVEKRVRDFYDTFGWVQKNGKSGEDALFRGFSPAHYPYHRGVNARTMECFSRSSGKLLMAGGGDLPGNHVEIARKFSRTTCLDISRKALEIARKKLGDGEFINGSILNVPKPDDEFDVAFCAHVIYHIDKDLQERAVRELIRVTKPGGKVVIIYSNPRALAKRVLRMRNRARRPVRKLRRLLGNSPNSGGAVDSGPELYFFAHPLSWWSRFKHECDVTLLPWNVMSNVEERYVLRGETVGKLAYRLFSWLEHEHPDAAVKWWSYPVVVLVKRADGSVRFSEGRWRRSRPRCGAD